jgi:hypothetical protein
VSAPKKIDGDGTIKLINAASEAGVEQFVLITSLGTGKIGFPASILNLFWGRWSTPSPANVTVRTVLGMSAWRWVPWALSRDIPGGLCRPLHDQVSCCGSVRQRRHWRAVACATQSFAQVQSAVVSTDGDSRLQAALHRRVSTLHPKDVQL